MTNTSRNTVLSALLRVLVDEWGYGTVSRALTQLSADSSTLHQSDKRKITRSKPLAVEQVERLDLPQRQREALQQIAARFDSKQFLHNISDVREFLILMGRRPQLMKDRTEAFRK